MNNKEIALKIAKILDDKKAIDIVVIDVSEKSSFADYLIVASGRTHIQAGTLTTEVIKQLVEDGVDPRNVEGKKESGWILLDYGDIIVNIFTEEERNRYNIEKIWSDCKTLDLDI
ncbi:MAG: ribosome silencing factor [Clostridiales bacterium]|nr:ribosome silencing factor [Clostridiales bacterium]